LTNTKEVRIEICTLCNYKCKFCPHEYDFHRDKTIMNLDMFKSILLKINKEAPYIDFLSFSGMGETFLDPTIFDKIQYAKDLGYQINILTNGSLFNEEKIKKLVDLDIYSLHISLHSANREKYQEITKADELDNVVQNIKKINKFKKNMKLIINCVIPEYDEKEINLIRELIESEVDLLEIWKPHNWNDWASYREGDINKTTCGRPFNGPLQIQIDGTINMCCFDYDGKLILGDFKNQTLEEVFTGEEYIKLYKTHKEDKILESDYICKNCDQIKNVGKIIYYNSKYNEEERVGRVSSTFEKMHN